jgi:hypothetical protein
VEYYSALKGTQIHAAAGTSLEDVMLRRRKKPLVHERQIRYTVAPVKCHSRAAKCIDRGVEWGLPGTEKSGDGELLLNGYRVCFRS